MATISCGFRVVLGFARVEEFRASEAWNVAFSGL